MRNILRIIMRVLLFEINIHKHAKNKKFTLFINNILKYKEMF